MIVIGITGTLGAGKGTIVEILKEKGFKHYSVRDFLVERISQAGMKVDRDSLTIMANHLRENFGADYIVRSILETTTGTRDNCIIESIRNTSEIEYLRRNACFYLLSVDADIKVRYERILQRKSETDNVDFKTFVKNEQREMSSLNITSQNIAECMAMADFTFDNSGSLAALEKQVEETINKIEHKNCRPTWDEYFIELANAAARRATCDRGRSGCVIVKDRQVLVTGYVGSPMGLPHCDEVGHLFKQTTHEDGTITNHCVRTVHAEQNAICQAAKRGIAINGSTLYCRMTPCRTCAMLIINCGIKRVVCEKRYHTAQESEDMFLQAGVELVYFSTDILEYSNQ
ncbi:MAG: AAA family ATPase [Bacteroidales bacterium]|jgi:dCMP deaminase|nr:AAA family ATPase [Bacteroidales bacterium]